MYLCFAKLVMWNSLRFNRRVLVATVWFLVNKNGKNSLINSLIISPTSKPRAPVGCGRDDAGGSPGSPAWEPQGQMGREAPPAPTLCSSPSRGGGGLSGLSVAESSLPQRVLCVG